MDLSDPGLMLSGLVISVIGLGVFLYGKRMESFSSLGVGIVMMAYPMFVHSLLMMWLIAAACLAALYLLPRGG